MNMTLLKTLFILGLLQVAYLACYALGPNGGGW